MLLCSSCGSKGVHIGCGRLDWSTMEWDCEDCNLESRRMIAKSENKISPAFLNAVTITNRPAKRPRPPDDEPSSEESDVDIESVPDLGSPSFARGFIYLYLSYFLVM